MELNQPDESEDIPSDGSCEHLDVERFGFLQEDRLAIQQLIAGIRRALSRRSITPQQICGLGKLLHGLERFPRSTESLFIEVSIGSQRSEGFFYRSLELTESSFELRSGGTEYSPDIGGDTYTSFRFLVETGGFRQAAEVTDIEDWVHSFVESLCDEDQDFEVDDENAGSALDWDGRTPEDDWDRLDSEY